MVLVNETDLENVCGGHNIRKTRDAIVTAGLAWIVCSVCAVSSVFLIKDIQKNCNELKKYPKIDDERIYNVEHVTTIYG